MKAAIIVHGHHLQAGQWELVVWGDPKHGVYGRAAVGLREALRFNASFVIFGTGASFRDHMPEAEHVRNIARNRIAELPEFSKMGIEAAQAWLDAHALLETTAVDTRTEIEADARIALAQGCDALVLVSSPVHIMRAHKTALALFSHQHEFKPFLHNLFAVASDVNYEHTKVDDVVIIEPHHRPDRPKVAFHETLQGLGKFMRRPDLAPSLNKALKDVIDDYEKKL
jgi:hypothetical protein